LQPVARLIPGNLVQRSKIGLDNRFLPYSDFNAIAVYPSASFIFLYGIRHALCLQKSPLYDIKKMEVDEMVSKTIPYFNLRKIMNSGQIFRMYEPEVGRFVVFSGNKRLELYQHFEHCDGKKDRGQK
jgi:hypothetical protein